MSVFFKSARNVRKLKLFLLILPFLAIVFVFHYVPLVGWAYGFVDYIPGVQIHKQAFAGLRYFELLFSGVSDFPNVLRNTLVLGGLKILTMVVPVIFAILLSQVPGRKFSRFVQTACSIPNFLSWVLVFAIFFFIFSAEEGAFNRIMLGLGLMNESVNLMGDADIAWGFQTFVSMWKLTGWEAIIYIAAMTGIDPEQYDAADVDGAGRFHKIVYVTIPGILPTFCVLLLMNLANILSSGGFEQFYVFQNPVVISRLEVFDTYIYQMGIISGQYAYATAMGCLKSVVSIFLLAMTNYGSKIIRGESIF